MYQDQLAHTAPQVELARQEQFSLCETPNVGFAERMASATIGGALVSEGLKRFSFGGLVTALIGGALVHRGVTGVCQMYSATGTNTAYPQAHPGVRAQQGARVERTILINRSREDLFRFWREFENLPRVMDHLVEVRQVSARRSHWVAKGPLDSMLEWEAEIINERDPELIAWQSVGQGDVNTAGSVHFMPAAADAVATLVHLSMKYNPPGGKLGVKAAEFLQQDLERMLDDDLRQFKTLMEADEIPTAMPQPTRQSAV